MAHEFESGLFVGTPAWHGLGTVLPQAPSIDEAIRCSGLDWKVRLAPLQLSEDGRRVSHQATVRESDNSILGVVGPDYVPLQNADAFRWFAPFIDSGEASIEAAGSLRDGKRVWVLARIKDAVREVVAGDEIRQHVLLAHAHDGTLAVRVGFTAIRVVCNNTLQAALGSDASKLIRVHHNSGTVRKLEKLRDGFDLARAEFHSTSDALSLLARKPCNEETLKRYAREVFAPGRGEDPKAAPQVVAKVLPLFEAGRGAELSRGTLWGGFNAITEFVTHERGKNAATRLESQWFGDGAALIKRSLDVGLAFAAAA